MEENLSLGLDLEATARAVYRQALERAAIETGLSRQSFPADLPYGPSWMVGDEGDLDDPVSI